MNWKLRVAGVMLAFTAANYLPWMIIKLNDEAWWLSVPFAVANVYLAALAVISVVNNWTRTNPELRLVDEGEEPLVGIIIPTYNEDPDLILATLESILAQDYPHEKMVIFVTDDGRRELLRTQIEQFAGKYPLANVYYHTPAPHRDNKAGNMNDCARRMMAMFPDLEFVETRDCDDLVTDPMFLRAAVGALQVGEVIAYTQSIKECEVATGDPFGNLEATFYRGSLPARFYTNSVFPCGSGVLYRTKALAENGWFDVSGPVEDLRTGYKLLKAGWKSSYLPLVGAHGQTAPEDIPNVLKQRGTWAVDTQSLLIWDSPLFAKGLSLRQRLHFLELNMFYFFSFFVLFLMMVPVIALVFGVYPLITTHAQYTLHFWPFAIAVEFYLTALARKLPYESLWRSRQLWISLAPVFVRATFKALFLGPNKKPTYKVTRKSHEYGFYLKETWQQWSLMLILAGSIVYHAFTHDMFFEADLGSMFWAGFFAMNLLILVKGSWHGVPVRHHAYQKGRQAMQVATRPVVWAMFVVVVLMGVMAALSACQPVMIDPTVHAQEQMPPAPNMKPQLVPQVQVDTDASSPVDVQQDMQASQVVPLHQPNTLSVGGYFPDSPYDGFASVKAFENRMGVKLSYVIWFQAWGDGDQGFAADWVAQAQAAGWTSIITWEPWKRDFAHATTVQEAYSFGSIVSGQHDNYIRSWAAAAKDTGVPIILRFAHEQSTQVGQRSWYPWQGDPTGYVAAFRHIHDIFMQEGATNVQFLWSAMWLHESWTPSYYPGGEYVDIVGTTILNHGTVPTTGWAQWFDFDYLFASQHQAAAKWGKPIMITELGSAEQGGDKASWIHKVFEGARNQYPLLKSVVLLETPDREWTAINWSVTSSPEAEAAFLEELK